MHFLTLIAFACLFWHAEEPGRWIVLSESDVLWTAVLAGGQPPLWGLLAWLTSKRSQKLAIGNGDDLDRALRFHHRATSTLRMAALVGFAGSVFLTHWAGWFQLAADRAVFQILGDVAVVSLYLAGLIAIWIGGFPFERSTAGGDDRRESDDAEPVSTAQRRLAPYLDFHLRHYFLVIAVPISIILFAANIFRANEDALRRWTGWYLTPDVGLSLVAAGVFLLSPLLLKRIWRTTPLPPGPVRSRLETLYDRIGLRFRDILIWHSDGQMINAAVMGIFAPVRYVMLSDGLLQSMSQSQIEAVFGHEAGHVKHRHMQFLLLFAFVGWLLVASLVEWLARSTAFSGSTPIASATLVEGAGLLATAAFWALGFGWMSRRFERQADAFGARCVAPGSADCVTPCSVHLDGDDAGDDGSDNEGDHRIKGKALSPDRVCATGAAIFTSALDRVALLNGIPHEERSWRHSSIGSRIRFLTSLAGDPGRAVRFENGIRRTKKVVLLAALLGGLMSAGYLASITQSATEPVSRRALTDGPSEPRP